jgi:hypothetical protein
LNAIMPELIPADVLVPGNALRGLSTQSARVIGPLVGGLIVAAVGAPVAFAVDAATFAFSFGVFFFARQLAREPEARKPLLHEIRDGVAYTFSVTWIWVSIIGFAATNGFFFAGFTVAMPILVFQVLKGSAFTYGLINAVAAMGELTGGLLVGNVHFKRLLVGTYLFSALLGIAFAVIGLAPLVVIVMAGGFLFNLCLVLSNTHWDSALQTYVPARLLGRVTSIDFFGSYLVGPVAPVVAAAVLLRVGPAPIFVVGGLIAAAYWVVAMALVRPDRRSPLESAAARAS